MKKILYIVATQYDNMGDLLINKCLVDELAEYGHVYLDTKKVPIQFKRILLEHENVFELSTISKISLKGKGLFLLPFVKGFKFDYMFKSPGPFGGSKTLNQKFRGYIFHLIFWIMKKKGVKSFLIGNDFIIDSAFDKKIFKGYESVLEGIFVRSHHNVETLKKFGVKKVSYSPDLCFMMKVDLQNSIKTRVGISFRDMEDESSNKVRKAVEIFVNYFSKKKVGIDIFYQVERDRAFNLALYNEFENEFVVFRNEVLSFEERDFYLDKSVLLSNRLHVLLLGQMYECLPLALLYGHSKTKKIKDIYDTLGMDNFVFSSIQTSDLVSYDVIYDSLILHIKEVNRREMKLFHSCLKLIFKA